MTEVHIAQGLGFLSFAIGVYAFSQKSDIRFKTLLCGLFTSQTMHFYLLDAYTASAACFISLIRTFSSLRFASNALGYFFIGANILWGCYLFTGITSLLAITGTSLGTYAMFFLSGIKMRLTLLIGTLCWLSHNIIVHSIGGSMLELMILITNILTIIRLYKDQRLNNIAS